MFSVQNTSTHGKVLVYSEVLSSSEHTSPSLGIIHTVLNAQVLLCSSLQKQLIVSNEWKHFEQWSYKKTKEQSWLHRIVFENCTRVIMPLLSSRCCVILCWLEICFNNQIQTAFLFLVAFNYHFPLCSFRASWNPVSTD